MHYLQQFCAFNLIFRLGHPMGRAQVCRTQTWGRESTSSSHQRRPQSHQRLPHLSVDTALMVTLHGR